MLGRTILCSFFFYAQFCQLFMKTLFLVRHAKSSWDDPLQNDFDRPLNSRGKKDAPAMAKRLQDRKVAIDTFVSSPAKRAKRTAQAFAEIYHSTEEKILYRTELYHADAETFFAVIESLADSGKNIAIFSHNPGITDFVNRLSVADLVEMPTCSIFALTVETNEWKNFRKAKKGFLFFDYPKSES